MSTTESEHFPQLNSPTMCWCGCDFKTGHHKQNTYFDDPSSIKKTTHTDIFQVTDEHLYCTRISWPDPFWIIIWCTICLSEFSKPKCFIRKKLFHILNHCAYPIRCVGTSLSIRQPHCVPPHLIVPTHENIWKLAYATFMMHWTAIPSKILKSQRWIIVI